MLVISGIVSIDHVHCQSKSTTIYHGAYDVNTLKVEIETVRGRKMSFSHSYHSPHRFLVRWLSLQYWTLSLVGYKRYFTCSLLCHFQFLVSFKWFVRFRTVLIDPPLFVKSWHLTYKTFSFITFLTLPIQTNDLLRSLNNFEIGNFMEGLFFIKTIKL